MAGIAKVKAPKTTKKKSKKVFVRPSQKKSVKNGRHQEKQTIDKKAKVAKTVAAIPAGLDGAVIEDEDYADQFGDIHPDHEAFDDSEAPENDEFVVFDNDEMPDL